MTTRVHFSDELLTLATVCVEPNWLERLCGATERTYLVVRDVGLAGRFVWWDDSRACSVTDPRIVRTLERELRAADQRQIDNAQWARRQRLSEY